MVDLRLVYNQARLVLIVFLSALSAYCTLWEVTSTHNEPLRSLQNEFRGLLPCECLRFRWLHWLLWSWSRAGRRGYNTRGSQSRILVCHLALVHFTQAFCNVFSTVEVSKDSVEAPSCWRCCVSRRGRDHRRRGRRGWWWWWWCAARCWRC